MKTRVYLHDSVYARLTHYGSLSAVATDLVTRAFAGDDLEWRGYSAPRVTLPGDAVRSHTLSIDCPAYERYMACGDGGRTFSLTGLLYYAGTNEEVLRHVEPIRQAYEQAYISLVHLAQVDGLTEVAEMAHRLEELYGHIDATTN